MRQILGQLDSLDARQKDVDAPAERLARIMLSLAISLILMSSFAYMDGRMNLSKIGVWTIFTSLAALCSIVWLILNFSAGKQHGSLATDEWISRDNEVEMRDRLQREMDEAGIDRLATNWAKMEMFHLESKHSEEE